MEQAASILFEKFLNGTCSKEELDRLMEILQQNEHEATFRSMLEKVYSDIDRSLNSDTFVSGPQGKLQQSWLHEHTLMEEKNGRPKSRKISRKRYLLAAAACMLLVLGGAYLWKSVPRPQASGAHIKTAANNSIISQAHPLADGKYKNQQTARAEQKYLLLPDGTQVWLNAESSLIVPDEFDQHKRVVYLKGEAFFDVKHADKIPFIIHMPGNVKTTVLGTAFDIKAYGDKEFSVSVKRGKVQVSKDRKALATLTVGQQIQVVDLEKSTPAVKTVNQANIASWTEGKLVYDALDLEDILKDIERVYDTEIVLKNKHLAAEIITTTFNRGDSLESVIKTLCLLTGARFSRDEKGYTLE